MTFGSRPPLALTLPAIVGALMLLLAPPAGAQSDAAKPEGLERAQKAADAVFHWIKLNADKGASRQTPAPAPAPPPAPRKPAPVAAAPKPVQPSAAAAATTPAQAPAPTVAAAPEPEQAPVLVAAAAPTPTPEAPMAAAARAVEPPPAPAAEAVEAEMPLKLLVKVDPIMPRQMQQQLNFRTGFAQVQFTVAPDGRVSQAQTVKASHARLGNAAVEAVKQWRFAPIAKAREAAVEVGFSNGDE